MDHLSSPKGFFGMKDQYVSVPIRCATFHKMAHLNDCEHDVYAVCATFPRFDAESGTPINKVVQKVAHIYKIGPRNYL